jgi:hypothetical protein
MPPSKMPFARAGSKLKPSAEIRRFQLQLFRLFSGTYNEEAGECSLVLWRRITAILFEECLRELLSSLSGWRIRPWWPQCGGRQLDLVAAYDEVRLKQMMLLNPLTILKNLQVRVFNKCRYSLEAE